MIDFLLKSRFENVLKPYINGLKSIADLRIDHLYIAYQSIDNNVRKLNNISDFMSIDIDKDLESLQKDIMRKDNK